MDRTPHPLAVLVVDDSVDTAESLAEILRLRGHEVKVAFNGEDALRSVAMDSPDVVFLDIRMPGQDGCQVAEQIRQRCVAKRPLLIAVTGCTTEADRVRTTQAGFDLHLVKPVDPAVLIGMMERFRRLFTPPIPAEELAAPPEDPPDSEFLISSTKRRSWFALYD